MLFENFKRKIHIWLVCMKKREKTLFSSQPETTYMILFKCIPSPLLLSPMLKIKIGIQSNNQHPYSDP